MSIWIGMRRASRHDLWLAARAAVVAVLVEVGLRIATLPTVARLLGVTLETGRPEAEVYHPGALPMDVVRRVDVAWRLLRHRPFNGTCLRRALVGAWAIREQSHVVRIGVRKVSGGIAAHAWLVVDGVSLDPDADLVYDPLRPVDVLRVGEQSADRGGDVPNCGELRVTDVERGR